MVWNGMEWNEIIRLFRGGVRCSINGATGGKPGKIESELEFVEFVSLSMN